MQSAPPLVRLVNADKYFVRGVHRTWILREVDVTVERGDFVALTGPSGSGKSTLLNVLGLTSDIQGGHIYFDGQNVDEMTAANRARLRQSSIGYVFQNFNLLNHLNGLDNVLLPLKYQPGSEKEKLDRAHIALEQTGIYAYADALPHEMSGGQQQRVAIARAIVTKPALILADEPTGNLDAAAGTQIFSLLQSLNAEGMTIVCATHSIDHANRAKHRYDLSDGVLTPIRIMPKVVAA